MSAGIHTFLHRVTLEWYRRQRSRCSSYARSQSVQVPVEESPRGRNSVSRCQGSWLKRGRQLKSSGEGCGTEIREKSLGNLFQIRCLENSFENGDEHLFNIGCGLRGNGMLKRVHKGLSEPGGMEHLDVTSLPSPVVCWMQSLVYVGQHCAQSLSLSLWTN